MDSRTHGVFAFISLALVGQLISATGYNVISEETDLTSELLGKYKSRGVHSRPVRNATDTLHVGFSIKILHLEQLDAEKQVLTSVIRQTCVWTDAHLTWDPAEFGGVEKIRLSMDTIWKPDLQLHNAVDAPKFVSKGKAVVSSDGRVTWTSDHLVKSSCEVDIMDFPFDTHVCHFNYSSSLYDGDSLNPSFHNDKTEIDFPDGRVTQQWEIRKTEAEKGLVDLDSGDTIPCLSYAMTVRRTAGMFYFILILPTICLALLTFLMFILPISDRNRVGVALNSSYLILLLLVRAEMPESSIGTPRIGKFVTVHMIINFLLIFFMVVVACLKKKGLKGQPLPRRAYQLFVVTLGKLFCVGDMGDTGWRCCEPNLKEPSSQYDITLAEPDDSKKLLQTNSKMADSQVDGLPGLPPLASFGLQTLASDVRTIANHAKRLDDKTDNDAHKLKMTHQWDAMLLVFDRILCLAYTIAISCTISIIMPWPL